MSGKATTKRGDERDATTRTSRRAITWNRGEVAAVKRRINRRDRRATREALRNGHTD